MSVLKNVGGKDYAAGDFAYVGDPQDISTWHLLLADEATTRGALGQFDPAQMPDAGKRRAAYDAVLAACKKFGIPSASFEMANHTKMALSEQWLEIFRAGDYGDKGAYTAADIDRMIAEYDPAQHEAPLVVGHPERDAPAFGWVEKLRRVGDVLQAKPRQVAPDFEEMVREGRFKKRSVAFYRDAGGKLHLRHIGFLGAHPPELKGLADASFGEQRRFQSIEFARSEAAPAGVDPVSIQLRDAARKLAIEAKITFGEALRQLRSEGWHSSSGAVQIFAERSGTVESVELRDAARALVRESSGTLTFGEALRQLRSDGWQSSSGAVQVFAERSGTVQSVELRDAARALVRESGGTLTFGEALRQLRSDGWQSSSGAVQVFAERTGTVESLELRDAARALVREAGGALTFGEALKQLRSEGWGT